VPKQKAIFLQLLTAVGALTGCIVSLVLDGVTDTASQITLPFTAGFVAFLPIRGPSFGTKTTSYPPPPKKKKYYGNLCNFSHFSFFPFLKKVQYSLNEGTVQRYYSFKGTIW
jgi:hypothetical protein